MRTTVTLDDDVATAVRRARRERSVGVSEAINDLIRAGMPVREERSPFVQQTAPAGLRIDVRDVEAALNCWKARATVKLGREAIDWDRYIGCPLSTLSATEPPPTLLTHRHTSYEESHV